MDNQGTFTMLYSCHQQILLCSPFLAWVVAQKRIAVCEFCATDHTEAFGKSLQQVTGIAHILCESLLSPPLEEKLRKLFGLEKGRLLGGLVAPSSTKRAYKRAGAGL